MAKITKRQRHKRALKWAAENLPGNRTGEENNIFPGHLARDASRRLLAEVYSRKEYLEVTFTTNKGVIVPLYRDKKLGSGKVAKTIGGKK